MKTLLKTIAVLVGIFIIYFTVGLLTPKNFKLEVSQTFDNSISDCWKVITSIDSYPSWRNDIIKLKYLDTINRNHYILTTDVGNVEYKITSYVPFEKLQIEMLNSPQSMTGKWTYFFEGNDKSCTVTIVEDSHTSKVLVRSTLRMMGRNTLIKRDFIMLQAILEKYY